MLLYYITDRTQFAGNEAERRRQLLERISQAARSAIDYVQLRERDLPTREIESLARQAVDVIHAARSKTRLLINARTDVALAVGADGVHLRSSDVSGDDVRQIWQDARRRDGPLIGISCHTEQEVARASAARADFVVFGPVFEKQTSPEGQILGLEGLRSVTSQGIPVLALGGVTAENAPLCIQAGAKGVAGIRLFQTGDLFTSAAKLQR